ncbi:MAG: hypothetical protein KDA28_07525, partial [Phycisphaerales bacterium]|nr:hypothetical protein [Phycisphaerales bacterium]
ALDGPFTGIQDTPLDLPTILPPGDVAHMLISLDVERIVASLDASISIDATGTRCPVDLAIDGVLDINDIIAFLGRFDAGEGDWNGDGIDDVFDVIAFLEEFAAGC